MNAFTSFLQEHRPAIEQCLQDSWKEYCRDFEAIDTSFGRHAEQFSRFLRSGKLLRGGLLLLSAEIFSLQKDALIPIAAAMEYLQSFLLIHDDVIDRSSSRRGLQTMHRYYASQLQTGSADDAEHFGISLAICLGDVVIFCAQQLLTKAGITPAQHHRISQLISQEIMRVGVAQMLDVRAGHMEAGLDQKHLEGLYRYKTARYTFCLPFLISAVLADAKEVVYTALERYAESLGILFQIQDDILDVNAVDSGKSKAIDIQEHKQTIVRLVLEKHQHPAVQHFRHSRENSFQIISDACKESAISEEFQNIIRGYCAQAEEQIAVLRQAGLDCTLLQDLVHYSRQNRH